MKRIFKKLYIITDLFFLSFCFAFLFASTEVTAQYSQQNDKMNYLNLGKKFYAEVHFLPGESEDSINVLAFFRFTYDMISFEKSGIFNISQNNFYSIPKIDLEFKDSEGIIRHRELWQDTIFSDNFEKTISKSDFIYACLQTKLIYKDYEIDIRLSDKNNQLIKKISIRDSIENFYDKPNIGPPIFTEIIQNEEKHFIPYVLKNKLEFSSKHTGMLIPVSCKNDFSKFSYICKFIGPKSKNELKWKSDFYVNSVVIPEKNSTINVFKSGIDQIEITTKLLKSATTGQQDENIQTEPDESKKLKSKLQIGILHIALPPEEMVPGEYELQLVESESADTMKYKFEVIWEDMPIILQKPKYAIESMYYILTDEIYKKMLDADDDNFSEEIINYWKKEDPSQSSAYNESMAEYFKRVDYAIFNFRTLNESNGVKTDRGKIYILYGPASDIERNLAENKAFEIWKYEHLKKIFIFETLANDVFKLVDIKAY